MPMYRAQVRAANLRINISFSASRFLPILQPRAFMFKHGMVRGETAFPCWSTQRTLDLLLICREIGKVAHSTCMVGGAMPLEGVITDFRGIPLSAMDLGAEKWQPDQGQVCGRHGNGDQVPGRLVSTEI